MTQHAPVEKGSHTVELAQLATTSLPQQPTYPDGYRPTCPAECAATLSVAAVAGADYRAASMNDVFSMILRY